MHRCRDLVPAVEHTRMRKDDDPAGRQRRSEAPTARTIQALQRSALAHGLVLRAVELVNLLLQPSPFEAHRWSAGLNVYAFSAPMPTP